MSSVSVYAMPFTILAQSGLNVRKGPSLESEKIGSLAFGTVVEAEGGDDFDGSYDGAYNKFSEVIEGKRGFWMKISYRKLEGYIFSGFGLSGEWVVTSTAINSTYRLLRAGQYCGAINYDPKLNWYALLRKNGKLSVEKTEVTLRLIHEFNEQDTLGESNDLWSVFPLIVQASQKDSVLFLIGSKNELEEGAVQAQFLADRWGYLESGKFLFPEQFYNFYYAGKSYRFLAFEDVRLSNEYKDGYVKTYQIEFHVLAGKEEEKFNLSKELGLKRPAKPHCGYRTPQLILVGDINKDGLPDFIYYSHTMTDSGDVCWEHYVFLSNESDSGSPAKKVANEISCNCIS